MFMVCSMNKPPFSEFAAAFVLATDPELVRLKRQIDALHQVAETGMAAAEALSKDPDKLLETADSFLRLADEVTRAIAQSARLREKYRRRRETLEADRARRLARARAAFLAAGSPPAGTRH